MNLSCLKSKRKLRGSRKQKERRTDKRVLPLGKYKRTKDMKKLQKARERQ